METFKFSILVVVILFKNIVVVAQTPPICGNVATMKSFCAEACIICDINGFTGRNNSSVIGQAPSDFCTSQVHHMQWIGFIAGTTDLTLEVKVSNCSLNNGLEIGLYESLNCTTFRKVSDCDTDVRPNTTRVFKNTVPLTIGQYYYFVMDGSANDICDWTIKVVSGSTKVLPLNMPPSFELPHKVCESQPFIMKTEGLIGATIYNWIIDGVYVKSGKNVNHTLTKPGTYKVCLEAANVCDKTEQTCKTIDIAPISKSSISQQVCFGECFMFHGNKYCSSGNYDIKLQAANGCDSIVTLQLVVANKITASTSVRICEGDTLSIGNGKIRSSGTHQVIISNQEECDIYLSVDVQVIICNIKTSTIVTNVLCTGENTGSIQFKIDAGTPPFNYSGFKIENPSIQFEGFIPDTDQYISIPNVDEGNYYFIIHDTYGNSKALNVFVSQPPPLKIESKRSNYGGYEVSCYTSTNGFLKLQPNGGVPPYMYSHIFSDSKSDSLGDLSAGSYKSVVTDANFCTSQVENILRQPDSLQADILFTHPGCLGLNTGNIQIKSIIGGTGPYQTSRNDSEFSNKREFSSLTAGLQSIKIKDNNNCFVEIYSELVAAEIPKIQTKIDKLQISLGDVVQLAAEVNNVSSYTIRWSPIDQVDCSTCITTAATPLQNTIYTIVVTSKDSCEDTSQIDVMVDKKRSFVMSNVVSPNNDGNNEKIKIYSGNDLAMIHFIKIYDRWGNLMYEAKSLNKGIIELDWELNFNGSSILPGVCTWIAKTEYIDHEILIHRGTISVLK